MKKEQFKGHIKKINKISLISSIIIIITAYAVRFAASPEQIQNYLFEYSYSVIFLLILVHLKTNNLKQRAIIRYITDSISDIET